MSVIGEPSSPLPDHRPRPLDGITVVTLEHAIAAPFATRQLADLGARVIKVERPDGGDFARDYDRRVRGRLASHFAWCNRSKESLAVDLKSPRGLEVLHALVAKADVVVQNLAPGAARRLGLGAETLLAAHPRLVLCDISGFGPGGPYGARKAYDLLVQAEAGLLSITGTPDEMAKVGISIADIATGMYAFTSILGAIRLRDRTGEGAHVEVSMLEALGEWMGFPLYYSFDGAPPPARAGAAHATIYPYGPFPTGDGGTVLFGLQNEREWATFAAVVLGDASLATDGRFGSNAGRVQHRDALHALIVAAFRDLDRDAVMARLDAAGIANAGVNAMEDVWAHPQLRARHRWREVDSEVGPIPALLPPTGSDRFAPRMDPVPALGEHTAEILRELELEPEPRAAGRGEPILHRA
ncbi:MAG: CoA transferase [Gluconacetobacter diazotrophicus]|nr:CoA transferase [Gluconacetobacter diazotrophicus]